MITSALIALLAIAGPAAAQAGPVYNLDNVCATLKTGSNYVYRGSTGYNFGTNVANASRFRFDATGLSRYSLRDHADQFAYQSVAAFVLHGNTFGPESEWTITATSSGKYTLVSTKSGQKMGNLLGSLGSVSTAAEFEITTGATGCVANRDIDPGVTTLGGPGVGNGKLLGWIDAHAHITAAAAFGGQIHCGEAFSPGGVEVAQAGCASHGTLGIGAILEAVIGGTDSGNSPEDGWPTFNDWPKPNTLLHEQSYYRGIERSWRSGLRVLNALYVANQWLCNLFPSRDTTCDETTQISAQNVYIQDMEKYIDAQSGGPGQGWFRIARTPAEVRTIAAAGKLAVVLGVESSELFGCSANPNATCTTAIINSGLDALQAMGVHGLYPVHKFDNAFGGTRFDEGNVGAAVNIGNQLSTGSWWSAVSCPTGPHDNHPPNSDLVNALVALGIFGNPGTPPNYPDGPVCNTRGLTTLGTHLINEMIRRGMVIHIDHMSVKTAQATLALAEAANYPGVVSVHSWSDPLIVDRILALGGFVAGYAHVATTPSDNPNDSAGTSFIDEWRLNKGLPHGANITGYGAGSDVNGLGLLPGPQVSPPAGPLQYPFTAPNGAVFNKQVFGNHTWDYNTEGVAQYGLYADWITDLVRQAGTDGALLKQHLWNGAEAYTKMWENARA